MAALLGGVPSHLDLSQSVYSSYLLKWECELEEKLGIFQSQTDRIESYSFLKGVASICLKAPFGAVATVAAMVEGIARIALAGITFLFSCCSNDWKEVPGNLWQSAFSIDRPRGSLSTLIVFLVGIALPFSEFAEMLPKIWEVVTPCLFSQPPED